MTIIKKLNPGLTIRQMTVLKDTIEDNKGEILEFDYMNQIIKIECKNKKFIDSIFQLVEVLV